VPKTSIAMAFAARDILGNMLSEVSLQFSRPFIVGDSISVSLSSMTG
jgi:small-conductance mechanosensitive channel